MSERTRPWVIIGVLLAAALCCKFFIGDRAASPEYHMETIQALEEKRDTVMELTAASTAVSVAISMLPGDVATPIAEKLAELSGYFLLVLSTIYLEKYLVTITGYAAFEWIVPIACVVGAAGVLFRNPSLKDMAKKLALFGILIVLIIPASVKMSNLIEETYETSMQATIDLALETTEEIEENAGAEAEEEKKGFFSELIDTVTEKVTLATDKLESVLNHYIEALAVLLVTSCLIPVLVLVFFIWLLKLILEINIGEPIKSFWEGHPHP